MPKFYYSSSNTYSLNNDNQIPITVSAVFSPNGNFKPVFIRYIYPDESEETLKVYGIKYRRDYHNYILFCCNVIVGNLCQELYLSYYIKEHTWMLIKDKS